MIVDAHAHIFPQVRGRVAAGPTRGLGYGRIAVGTEERQLLPPYHESTVFTPEMLVANMDWSGVDRAVLLQGTYYGDWNQYVLEAVGRYPDRLIGAAYLDPWAPNGRRQFEMVAVSAAFRAVKLELSVPTGLCGLHPEARLDNPDLEWLWSGMEERGLVLVLDLGAVGSPSYQTRAVRAITEQHPGLRIAIAHLGQPRPAAEADSKTWRLWVDQIDLGRLPNVFFDMASLPAYLPEEVYPYPGVGRYFRMAVERIGPAKIMWGTDQPGMLAHANCPQLLKLAHLHAQFLSAHERELVLGENAWRLYGR